MRLAINQESAAKEKDQEAVQRAYRELFNNKAGEVVLEDLASISGMYRTNFVQNNQNHTSFLEGQRSLFLYICSRLENNAISNIEGT